MLEAGVYPLAPYVLEKSFLGCFRGLEIGEPPGATFFFSGDPTGL